MDTKGNISRLFSNQYMLDYDYDSVEAYDHWDRCAGDYCRCTTIQNIRIESVDITNFFNSIIQELKKDYEEISPQHEYCIDRLLSIHRVFDTDLWEIGVCGGYYGQETSDSSFANETDLIYDIYTVMSLDTDDAVRYILEKEYGYVLSILEDKTFTVYTITLDEIHVSNENYMRKIYGSSEYPSGIFGLLLEQHDKLKLIDGHHRFTALMSNKDNLNKEFDYIIAEDKQ